MRGGRRSALAGAVLLLEVLVAACGRPGSGAEKPEATGASPKPATATATAPARFDEETELADGRHVGVSYAPGRGLLERHQDAGTGAWSEPHVVYRTASDPCQSTGNLSRWDTKLTRNFDGWSNRRGRRLTASALHQRLPGVADATAVEPGGGLRGDGEHPALTPGHVVSEPARLSLARP